jgi:Icc-related predicted phosphoesterase
MLDHTVHDVDAGSTSLRDRVAQLDRLCLHVYGHVHEARGQKVHDGCVFANVSLVDAAYRPYTLGVPVFEVAIAS